MIIFVKDKIENKYRNSITEKKIIEKKPNDLDKGDIIVDWLTLDYGNKGKNPVDKVMFYNKDYKEAPINSSDISNLLPIVYYEKIVQIYTRKKVASVDLFFIYLPRILIIN